MKKISNLFLIGYRGTGKTTLGKKVAQELKMIFIDADDYLVKKMNKTIPGIFSTEGETKFREYETQCLIEISKNENQVVAFGGGVITREENINILKENGIVCLLKADPKVIFEWTKNDKNRPSLTDKSPFEEIVYLLKKRQPFYEQAKDFEVDTGINNIINATKEIIKGYNLVKNTHK